MADLPAEGRANLERLKRFLLAVTVVVAAYFALGARVCDTATYSGFLVTIARPEHARVLLLVIWAWALLTYAQRLYKLFAIVKESIGRDVEAEDWRLAHHVARREAKNHLSLTELPAQYSNLRIDRKIKISRGQDTTGAQTEGMYKAMFGGRMYHSIEYTVRGIDKTTQKPRTDKQSFTLTMEPNETSRHQARAWAAAILRRPGITEHFGPLVAVAVAIAITTYYWDNPPHPTECRPSEQKVEASSPRESGTMRDYGAY
ncbi:MAG TPA: hypothetical protein VIB01_12290 [Steroidobacteraceae bacterium]|jgi:hypothetical protein